MEHYHQCAQIPKINLNKHRILSLTANSGGSKGSGGAPPRTTPNFLNFMQFFGKFGKIICW